MDSRSGARVSGGTFFSRPAEVVSAATIFPSADSVVENMIIFPTRVSFDSLRFTTIASYQKTFVFDENLTTFMQGCGFLSRVKDARTKVMSELRSLAARNIQRVRLPEYVRDRLVNGLSVQAATIKWCAYGRVRSPAQGEDPDTRWTDTEMLFHYRSFVDGSPLSCGQQELRPLNLGRDNPIELVGYFEDAVNTYGLNGYGYDKGLGELRLIRAWPRFPPIPATRAKMEAWDLEVRNVLSMVWEEQLTYLGMIRYTDDGGAEQVHATATWFNTDGAYYEILLGSGYGTRVTFALVGSALHYIVARLYLNKVDHEGDGVIPFGRNWPLWFPMAIRGGQADATTEWMIRTVAPALTSRRIPRRLVRADYALANRADFLRGLERDLLSIMRDDRFPNVPKANYVIPKYEPPSDDIHIAWERRTQSATDDSDYEKISVPGSEEGDSKAA